MGLRGQRVDNQGLYMEWSDGTTLNVTKAQVQTFYQSTSGNAAARKAATIAWIKSQITAAFGDIDPVFISLDFDVTTGDFTKVMHGIP